MYNIYYVDHGQVEVQSRDMFPKATCGKLISPNGQSGVRMLVARLHHMKDPQGGPKERIPPGRRRRTYRIARMNPILMFCQWHQKLWSSAVLTRVLSMQLSQSMHPESCISIWPCKIMELRTMWSILIHHDMPNVWSKFRTDLPDHNVNHQQHRNAS